MYIKIHETKHGRIVAACDKQLLGKVLEEGDIRLDLAAHRNFYEGVLADSNALKNELKRFTSANLVGEKAVKAALELELADESAVIYINDIPHIQLYRMGGL